MQNRTFVVFVVESLAGAAPLIDAVSRAGAPVLGQRFTGKAIAAAGGVDAYVERLMAPHAGPGGVFAAVVRSPDLRNFPFRTEPGPIPPRYVFLRQRDLLRTAAERLVETGGAAPDLARLRAALAQAALDAAYGPALVGDAVKLELEMDAVAADPARAVAQILAFAGLAAPEAPGAIDLAPSPPVEAMLHMVRAAAEPGPGAGEDRGAIALAMAARNDEDIVFSNLAWHFAAGARAFVVIDEASSDSTRAEIGRFIRACEPLGARVLVVDSRDAPEAEGRHLTAAARLAHAYFGARWILGVRPDEFVDVPQDGLHHLIARAERETERLLGVPASSRLFMAGVRLPVVDHLCTAMDSAADPNPLTRMPFRWRKPRPPHRTAARLALWAQDMEFGPHNEVRLSGGALPVIDGPGKGIQIRRFQVRSFEQFVRRARDRAGAEPEWRELAARLTEGGVEALRPAFEADFQHPAADLAYDPIAPLQVQGGRVSIDRSREGRRAPLNLALAGLQKIALGGVPFEPASIALKAPPAPQPVTLRTDSSDLPTFLQVFVREEYAIPLPTPPTYVLDLGANIGLAAAYLAGRYPEARIVSVEPDEENFRLLVANTEACGRVTALHAAVWPEPGVLEIVDVKENGDPIKSWGFQTVPLGQAPRPGGRGVRQIRAMSIPEIMAAAGFPRIDLLKVDVEGAELELFSQGDLSWIAHVQQAVVETHDRFRPGATAAVRAALADFEETRSGENLVFIRRVAATNPAPASSALVAE